MSEFQQIKKRIYEEDRIEYILEELECWAIDEEQGGKLIVAGLPDGDNKRSVQIKNKESLNSAIRSKGIDGDIFDVISFILYDADTEEKRNATLSKSKFWLCQKLKYYEYIDDFYKETAGTQPVIPKFNKWLNGIRKQRSAVEATSNRTYSNRILESFGIIPYKKWIDEGLEYSTQKLFEVGIDVKTDRVTFPVHNCKGEIIGIKGRYCGKKKEIEDNYKYLYLYPCNKSIEFFNFHRALPYIKEKNEVIIVEGGKTTMFLYQWGYMNCISIEGDSLSDYQVSILKDLGLNIKYIFAFDKDKDAAFVKHEVSKLPGRMKYGILDMENELRIKDSPTDRGKKVWDQLYEKHCFRIR